MMNAGPLAVLVANPVPSGDWRRAAAARGGRELDVGAETLSVEFPAVQPALAWVKELQRAGSALAVGIAVGDEPGVGAADLCTRAERGQVLVSQAAHALAVGQSGHEFRGFAVVELDDGGIETWELLWQEPEPRTRVRLCGSLELDIDGRDLAREAPKGQAGSLLRYLLANRDRTADRDELIDVIWSDRPPKDPQADLRPILSRVRRAISPATLEGRERLQLVLPEPVWVDVENAARAITAARAAAKAALWGNARENAEAALQLLRPGFLADDQADWAQARRRNLEELELEALEWLARSSLALGGPDLGDTERASRELIARAPYRETGYRFLMEALAATGNVAEALRVYDELRFLLRDELGVDPAAEVQELHRRLLAGDRARPAAAAEPTPGPSRRIPLPSLLSPRERGAFVGRGHELDLLRAAWQDARSGTCRLVLIVGEPGIGKTRLTSELALEAHVHGTVLYAGCQEEGLLSYQPFVDAIRHYARSTGLDWKRLSLGPGAAELARLIPELAAALPDAHGPSAYDPDTRRYLLFQSISLFFTEVSAHAPLLLVLDDLHWADRATVLLLRHLIRDPHGASLLIVGTYRGTEIGVDHVLSDLLADLRRDRLVERVSLDGLDEDDVAALIASHAGHQASPGLVETVHERTEGNPFFVEEVMRHLIETGVLFEREGRWVSARTLDEIGVPAGVEEVLARRLRRLSEDCRVALTHAGVLGREFSFDVLSSMAEVDEDALIAALEEAVEAQLVVEARGHSRPTYAFTHALVRETLYGRLSGPRRQRLHARAARAIKAAGGKGMLVEVAHHWYYSGDHGRALVAAVESALEVEETQAHAEALTQYEHALELWELVDHPERLVSLDRVDLGTRAAEAASYLGDPERAAGLIQDCLGHVDSEQDPTRVGSLLERLGRYLWIGGDNERALAAYEEAVSIVAKVPSSVDRARVLAALAHALVVSNLSEPARARSAEALEIAQALGTPIEEGRALATLGAATARLADPDEGLRLIGEGRALLERAGAAPDLMFITYAFESNVLEAAGRFELAVDAARRGIAFTRAHGMYRNHQGWLEAMEVSSLIKLGRWTEAGETLEAAILRQPTGITRRAVHLLHAQLLLARGDLDAAAESAAEGERAAHGDKPFTGQLFDVLAGLAIARRDFEAARKHVARGLGALASLDDTEAEARLRWRGLQAEADRAEGARTKKRTAEEERAVATAAKLLAPVHDLSKGEGTGAFGELGALRITCEAEFARAAGVHDAGLWNDASTSWEALHEPYPRAYCLLRAAEAAVSGRNAKTATEAFLRPAYEVARELGATSLASAIEAVGRRAGVNLP